MKFLLTYTPEKKAPPTPEQLAGIAQFSQEMAEAGTLLLTGGLTKASTGMRVHYAKGKHSVTDGPFAETKELIDGFALVEVASKEEAIEVARRFMQVAGDGDCEVQQVYEQGKVPY